MGQHVHYKSIHVVIIRMILHTFLCGLYTDPPNRCANLQLLSIMSENGWTTKTMFDQDLLSDEPPQSRHIRMATQEGIGSLV